MARESSGLILVGVVVLGCLGAACGVIGKDDPLSKSPEQIETLTDCGQINAILAAFRADGTGDVTYEQYISASKQTMALRQAGEDTCNVAPIAAP